MWLQHYFGSLDSLTTAYLHTLPKPAASLTEALPADVGGADASPEGLLLGEDKVLAPLRGRCALGDMREGPVFFNVKKKKHLLTTRTQYFILLTS